jgi:hypothetical protein
MTADTLTDDFVDSVLEAGILGAKGFIVANNSGEIFLIGIVVVIHINPPSVKFSATVISHTPPANPVNRKGEK